MTQNNTCENLNATEKRQYGLGHGFDVDLATELQDPCLAILISHFQFWIRHNKAIGRNRFEDRTWMYQTIQEISLNFPYWSQKQVERMINKLVEKEILIKGNFNKSPYDRTVWYAFKDENVFCISRIREIEKAESGNEKPEIGNCNNKVHILKTNTETNICAVDSDDAKQNSPPSKKKKKTLSENIYYVARQNLPHIKTTEEEHDKLILKYGNDVLIIYQYLNEWKESKSKVDPKSVDKHTDFYRIQKWAAKEALAQKQEQPSQKVSQETQLNRREQISKWRNQNLSKLQQINKTLEVYVDKVLIGHDDLYFDDPKYDELILHFMKKAGIQ